MVSSMPIYQYLRQQWLNIVGWTLGDTFQIILIQTTIIFTQQIVFENVVCKI